MKLADIGLAPFEDSFKPLDFARKEGGVLYRPEGILFRESSTIRRVMKAKEGIICDELSANERKLLRSKSVSYIVRGSEVFLVRKAYTLHLVAGARGRKFPYTTLISPAGLAILDTLITLSYDDLEGRTAVSLCREYDLRQTKMSQIQIVTETKTVAALKAWLHERKLDWWKAAFADKKSARTMTPFTHGKRYVSRVGESERSTLEKMMDTSEWNRSIGFSGIEHLKQKRELIDRKTYLCVDLTFLPELFRRFELMPAPKSGNTNEFLISPLRKSFEEESMFSHVNEGQLNTLRLLWGIQDDNERIQEARFNALKRYLRESKS